MDPELDDQPPCLLEICGDHLELLARVLREAASPGRPAWEAAPDGAVPGGDVHVNQVATKSSALVTALMQSAAAMSGTIACGEPYYMGERPRCEGAPTQLLSMPPTLGSPPVSQVAAADVTLSSSTQDTAFGGQDEGGSPLPPKMGQRLTLVDEEVDAFMNGAPIDTIAKRLRPEDPSNSSSTCQPETLQGGWDQDQMVLRELRLKRKKTENFSLRSLEESYLKQTGRKSRAYQLLRRIVGTARYEAFWAFVVCLNTITMLLEEECHGIARGHALGIYETYGSEAYLQRYWPNEDVFFVIDCLFAAAFTLEIVLTYTYDIANLCLGLQCHYRNPFWKEPWDIMDFAVVVFSDISLLANSDGPLANARFLRIFRLVRLLRLVRLVRKVHSLDHLHLLTTAIRGSSGALGFSMLLLCLILTMFAMLITQFFRFTYLSRESSLSPANKEQLYQYFGTYTRAMMTLFELALANWPIVCRFLMEEVHEVLGAFCVIYKLSVGFAVIGVINGVFIQETFTVAQHDEFIMVRSRLRQVSQHKDRLTRLFKLADQNDDGFLNRSELKYMLEKRAIRTWLEAMDVRCQDPDMLFTLLAGSKELISLEEFISGIGRLKGAARSIDLLEILQHRHSPSTNAWSTYREAIEAARSGCRNARCDTISRNDSKFSTARSEDSRPGPREL